MADQWVPLLHPVSYTHLDVYKRQVLARVAAGVWPEEAGLLHSLAGIAWIAAFGGYAVLYGRLLLLPRRV